MTTNIPDKNGTKKANNELIIFLPFIDFKMPSIFISNPAIMINKKHLIQKSLLTQITH